MQTTLNSQAESFAEVYGSSCSLNPTYRTAMSWFSGSGALDTFNGFKDKVQSKVNNIDTDKLLKNLTLQSGMLYVLTCTLHVLICCV